MGQSFKIGHQQTEKSLKITVEALPIGMYIIQFQQKNEIYYAKLLKE